MNEKIKQLATSVGISHDYLTKTKQWVLIEALAELIVRECAGVCDDLRDSTDYEFEKDMADNCAQAIMKRFGVEE